MGLPRRTHSAIPVTKENLVMETTCKTGANKCCLIKEVRYGENGEVEARY